MTPFLTNRFAMSKCNVTPCSLILLITLSQFLSGCTVSPDRESEEFISAGYSYANHIRLSGRELATYSRISGDSEYSVSVSDLIEIQSLPGNQFNAGIYVPAQFESSGTQLQATSESSPNFRLKAIEVVDGLMEQLPEINALDPYIRIVLAPEGSGVSIQTEQDLDTQRPVPITFVVPLEQSDAGFGWWKNALETLAHELLHLQHELSPPDPKGTEVDRETAAYLFGQCTVSRFAEKLGAVGFNLNIELNHSAWSDIESGQYYPKMEKIEQIGNPSRQGRTLALGYLYHLVPSGEGTINLVDEEVQEKLFSICDDLPASTPRFSRGLNQPK